MSVKNPKYPQTYEKYRHDELLSVYAAAPERLRQAVEGLTESELKMRPVPDKWCIQELVIHLADAEIMGAARIKQTYAEPGCTFSVYDQDAWAKALNYRELNSKSFYSYLILFDSVRLNNSKLFQQANSEDWQKSGCHPEWGLLTLRNLLEMYADHGERHLSQILTLRRFLKKPLALPRLLEERLY
ncbi:MAG: DinB family protein [bacterium]